MPALGLTSLTLCVRRRASGTPPPALATLQVEWEDNSAIEDGYRIRWEPSGGGAELQADTAANVESYTIAGLAWNTQYDVTITAVNGVGESDVLGPVALYTPPPAAPTVCTATATGATTATIGWTLPGTEPVTGYRIYRSPAGAGTWTAVGVVAAGVNTYAATGLTASTAYDWRVVAYNSNAGESQPDSETAPSNTASCTTSAASNPVFDREDQRSAVLGSAGTTVLTVATTFAVGKRAVLLIRTGLSMGVSGITDSAGNTWTIDESYIRSSHNEYVIASAHIASALTGGSATITITWGASAYSYKEWFLWQLSGVASSSAKDSSAEGEAFSGSVSTSITTVATNTCVVGLASCNTQPSYTPATFSQQGAAVDCGDGGRVWPLRLDAASAGAKSPAGSFGGSVGWGAILVAYKA